jgi:hypothetical protein
MANTAPITSLFWVTVKRVQAVVEQPSNPVLQRVHHRSKTV